MTKLNWEKAKKRRRLSGAKRDLLHAARGETTDDTSGRGHALHEYATKHNLYCFVCGLQSNPWAKTGNTRGRPWAICLPCVQRKRT